MRIVVDQDEVLAHFVDRTLGRWNLEHKTSFTREDINMWHMEDTLGAGAYEKITQWINERDWFDSLEPIAGAVEGFNELRKAGHDVVVCTSIAGDVENAYDGKRRWMKKHFPDFDLKNFYVMTRKGHLKGDVLIDDAAHYHEDWFANGGKRAIVMDAPWNRREKRAARAANWKQINQIIKFWVALDEYEAMQADFEQKRIFALADTTLKHVDKVMKGFK
jgi:5'(3')-deoxyribonucleotidase